MKDLFTELFIFEMANNHQGDVGHGISIIREMAKIAKSHNIRAGIKFQYRSLNTFIHPDFREDTSNKHISRFLSTELSPAQFLELVHECSSNGLIPICTPFDEKSVELIVDHGIEIIKVASCSADDWPLLEKIVSVHKPIIASTGGLTLPMIDNLVSFLRNRNAKFAILHCVGIYPTPNDALNIRFISKLRSRYKDVPIGYSGHEHPADYSIVQLASALGAQIFERHIGLSTDSIKLNGYSMNPDQVNQWIEAWKKAKESLGNGTKIIQNSESESLNSLKRGVFIKNPVKKGQTISKNDVFFAMPRKDAQLTSGEFGRIRTIYVASKDYKSNEPVFEKPKADTYLDVREIIHQAKGMLEEANVVLNSEAKIELSHHYGLNKFYKFGCLIVNLVNREYCKKIIIVYPGQSHPEQKHIKKEETFHVLNGEVKLTLNGITNDLKEGDIVTIERGVLHSFTSEKGCIIEEVSTTHFRNDSFYTDEVISQQDPMQRKTIIESW